MFQRLSPTSAEHVLEQLGERIDGIVDGGPCDVGVESTVVGFEGGMPVIYRPGAVSEEMIAECLGLGTGDWGLGKQTYGAFLPAPGMLEKHYSPDTAVFIGVPEVVPENSGLLAFGKLPENAAYFAKVLNLSESGNLIEAAANLYGMMHKMDSYKLDRIYAALLPENGIGHAINDRLQKAAAR
jgi:L-threonylcarbamoyladenylate synthase